MTFGEKLLLLGSLIFLAVAGMFLIFALHGIGNFDHSLLNEKIRENVEHSQGMIIGAAISAGISLLLGGILLWYRLSDHFIDRRMSREIFGDIR